VTAEIAHRGKPRTLHPLVESGCSPTHGYANGLTPRRRLRSSPHSGHDVTLLQARTGRCTAKTLDLCVILPEIAGAFRGRFRIGVLLPRGAHGRAALRFGAGPRW